MGTDINIWMTKNERNYESIRMSATLPKYDCQFWNKSSRGFDSFEMLQRIIQ